MDIIIQSDVFGGSWGGHQCDNSSATDAPRYSRYKQVQGLILGIRHSHHVVLHQSLAFPAFLAFCQALVFHSPLTSFASLSLSLSTLYLAMPCVVRFILLTLELRARLGPVGGLQMGEWESGPLWAAGLWEVLVSRELFL